MSNTSIPSSISPARVKPSVWNADWRQLLLVASAPLGCSLMSCAQAAEPPANAPVKTTIKTAQNDTTKAATAPMPTTLAQAQMKPKPNNPSGIRNVVVIFADDMGYDMASVGTPGIATPNLDKMVVGGTLFTNGYAAQAVCSPSRGALMTGMYPNCNGIDRLTLNSPITGFPFPNNTPKPFNAPLPSLRADVPTLIEQLRDNGYYSATTQKTHVQPIWRFPFDKGFNYHRDPAEYNKLIDEVKTEAGAKPFFIMANISPPHRPFLQHLQAMKLMDGQGKPKNIDAAKIFVPPYLPDTPAMRADLAEYYANVELVDDCVGGLMAGLKRNNLLDSTLIIFSSDHGFGYHRAKVSAYPAGLHVPIIVQGLGVAAGLRSPAPASLVDVMPTMLQALNLPIRANVQGASWWPVLSKKSATIPNRRTVLGLTNQHYIGRMVSDGHYYYIHNYTQPKGTWQKPPMNNDLYEEKPWGNHSFQATIDAKNKFPKDYEYLRELVEGDLPTEELYDIQQDPWGVNNLINKPELAGTLKNLRAEMNAWRVKTKDAAYIAERAKDKKPTANVAG